MLAKVSHGVLASCILQESAACSLLQGQKATMTCGRVIEAAAAQGCNLSVEQQSDSRSAPAVAHITMGQPTSTCCRVLHPSSVASGSSCQLQKQVAMWLPVVQQQERRPGGQERQQAATRQPFELAAQYIALAHTLQPGKDIYKRSLQVIAVIIPVQSPLPLPLLPCTPRLGARSTQRLPVRRMAAAARPFLLVGRHSARAACWDNFVHITVL